MEEKLHRFVEELIGRHPKLQACRWDIVGAYEILRESYENHGTLLVAGNGGSAADAEHIVGELMKEFKMKRKVFSDQAWSLRAVTPEMGDLLAAQGILRTLLQHHSLKESIL